MKNKKMILGLVALVLAVALMVGVYVSTRPETTAGAKTITVSVTHKDGTTKEFEYHTDEEYLAPVLVSEGLVEGEEGDYGLTIYAVDGETADWSVDQGWWQIFVGEESATTGASGIPVNDGDSFKLVYTIG